MTGVHKKPPNVKAGLSTCLVWTLTWQQSGIISFFACLWLFLWISFEDGNHTTHMHITYRRRKPQLPPASHQHNWHHLSSEVYSDSSEPTSQTTLSKIYFTSSLSGVPSSPQYKHARIALRVTSPFGNGFFKRHDRLICEEGKIHAFIFNPYTQNVAFHMSITRQKKISVEPWQYDKYQLELMSTR